MQSSAIERGGARPQARPAWSSTSVGDVVIAASSGLLLLGWVAAHMLGVLGALAGRQACNEYAAMLHRAGALLWAMRGVLLLALGLHIMAIARLSLRAWRARARVHGSRPYRSSSWAARSMRVGGGVLLLFIGLHLLHMTTGDLHPAFQPADVYGNLVRGLGSPLVVAGYELAVAALALHLRHGVLALARGFLPGRVLPRDSGNGFALCVGLGVFVGFSIVPLAIVTGVLR